ncbi:MAG: hypothetical protein K8S27_11960 [Candidatus Omnitrophica bacterium]|nr:hypothetical protein [Candidatus Omnitrophota bacterium]
MKRVTIVKVVAGLVCAGLIGGAGYVGYKRYLFREEFYKTIISRLESDSRTAEVLVTNVKYHQDRQKTVTTIKFLEYDVSNQPLEPKYFTFSGNIIQFQSLVVRFDDRFIKRGDLFKGRSVFLFWKVFMLDGAQTEEFEITPLQTIPAGYKMSVIENPLEHQFWHEFWVYALDASRAGQVGIKNAQIEAPGTRFVPGYLYTIKIEHDGGLRIDARKLPEILKGERILE